MKIQIASDLHFEIWERDLPDPVDQFAPDETRDLLILAGDITNGRTDHGLPFIVREINILLVIFVPGNHRILPWLKTAGGQLVARVREIPPGFSLPER